MALALGDDPVLDKDVLAAVRIGPARDIAGRNDSRCARFEIDVHIYAAVKRKTGLFGKRGSRTHADAGNHEIRIEGRAAFQLDLLAIDGASHIFEVEDHTVLGVKRSHEIAHLRNQDALQRSFAPSTTVKLPSNPS